MANSYNIVSKIYGLLDILFFHKNSPRNILLSKIPNKEYKILEIAIGTAENSILLLKNNPQLKITGIDSSEDMLKIAKSNIDKHNIKNIELIKMDGTNMQFENETFDFIIISLLLHELTEVESNKILKGCMEILKNNGKILILEWEYPKKLIQKILFSVMSLLEYMANKEFNQFMKKDLNEYFKKNGLIISNIDYGNYTKVIELKKEN
ncbi:MAG: class I SAM-dependent methyltransferase [Methanobrevibacter sp.]|jgi:demethylmenaquinone methyltransferase/2-methoxy-6-polyprenyl-1,4-benzoquinol methylase|nr:class I SAM-dependent methyltransferase [Candidatus Methanoflexus mossambicus]